MTLKNVKVTDEVKQQLDDYALDKETYNVTIQRLLLENMRLKEDKELLTRLLLKDDDLSNPSIHHKYVPFIEAMLYDNNLDDDAKLNGLVAYFINVEDISKHDLLSCIQIVSESHDITSGVLVEFKKYVESSELIE